MRVFRELASLRDPFEHRSAPRVAAEKPIAVGEHRRMVFSVTRHQFVQVNMRDKRCDQIVRATQKRHADAVRVSFSTSDYFLDSASVIPGELAFRLRIDERVKGEMTDVRER